MTSDTLSPTQNTRLKRTHERGSFDRETIYQILDASPLCHIGYLLNGRPAVTPTLHWRVGDRIYWHGSSASRALRRARDAQVCLTATLMDGYVMARSAYHHSMNFRSVMIYGVAKQVTDKDEKEASLYAMVEALIPGRWPYLRPINAQEFKATMVLSMPVEEASAKIRTGGPVDDEEDYALPIWAGTVPILREYGAPVQDQNSPKDIATPDHITDFANSKPDQV